MRNDANTLVYIGGKCFRCECGCNVFHRDMKGCYVCNSCDIAYIGE